MKVGAGEVALRARISPNAILAWAALLSLHLIVWFGTLAALSFLVTGALLWLRQPSSAADELGRYWWVFLLPLWCILSTFWSDLPQQSLRFGVQLAVTVAVAVAMASRLPPRTLVRVALAAYLAAGLASLLFGNVRADGAGWLGIYGSKNQYSSAISALVLLGLAVGLGPDGGRWWRRIGLASALLGVGLLVQGQSAGAIVTTGLAASVGLALLSLRRTTPSFRLVALIIVGLLSVAIALAAWSFRDVLAESFLRTTGKDVTLTGRTDLWTEALGAISERPLLGYGYFGFWIPGNPTAEAMWAKFGIANKTGFNFHNTWLHNAVDLGLIGLGIVLGVFATTLMVVFRWALSRQTAASLFFAMFMFRQAALSLVEVVAYGNFDFTTILGIAALVAGLRVAAATVRVTSGPLRPPGYAGRTESGAA